MEWHLQDRYLDKVYPNVSNTSKRDHVELREKDHVPEEDYVPEELLAKLEDFIH